MTSLKDVSHLPEDVQMIIPIFYCKKYALDLTDLLNLTNGNASSVYLNRKSSKTLYALRPDVQLVIFSNKSPYEVYASYNKTMREKTISKEDISAINDRFFVHRLDGDVRKEQERWSDPNEMPDRVCKKWIRKEITAILPRYEDDGGVVDLFYNVMKILKRYNRDHIPLSEILLMLPKTICGGISTTEAGAILHSPITSKFNRGIRVTKKLEQLVIETQKRSMDDDDDDEHALG